MTTLTELFDDFKFILRYRMKHTKIQRQLDRKTAKTGDMAPDFTLSDVTGTQSVTLSDFRGKKPVALVFGSYT